jgi:hypothetical protein
MLSNFQNTMNMIRMIYYHSTMKTKRNFVDFFSDRVTQSFTEAALLSSVNRLSQSVHCEYGFIPDSVVSDFIVTASTDKAVSIMEWIRKYPQIVAALCIMKKEEYEKCIQSITIEERSMIGTAFEVGPCDIDIHVRCLSPLAHGSDMKAGNATLFRRMNVLSKSGYYLTLPYYSGNAIRGRMRDLLADDFLRRIGLMPRRDIPSVSLWFFHVLYAGGALEENGGSQRCISKLLGDNGTVKSEGFYKFRNMLPGLSILGCALGNRILNGRCQVMDFRPNCKEWSNGDINVWNLFEWIYLTRREDYENYENNSSMIAITECLKAGSELSGGIDIDRNATDVEKSAIMHGIKLLSDDGLLGADNRRGLGKAEVTIKKNCEIDNNAYIEFIDSHKDEIIDFLKTIEAVTIAG